jgi:hypothetical protein
LKLATIKENTMRWESDAEAALLRAGYAVVDHDGVDDWQGWGALLASDGSGKWAVLSWSYGSCSGCDSYEELSESELEAAFDSEIEFFDTEEKARLTFSNRKGW